MDIFVGNLSFAATEDDIKKLFEGYGFVASVTILMRKEKKVPKSRGFCFVQMPDEQQALAAIAALNGKEFMERVINVEPARPKAAPQVEHELKEEKQPQAEIEAGQYSWEEGEEKKPRFSPVHNERLTLKDRRVRPSGRPEIFGSGRRTHSYIKRQSLSGLPQEARPRKRSVDNPMRWRKKKPWQKKGPGEHKPWHNGPGESKPWQKTEGEARPWKKVAGESKPWRKSDGSVKPWKKNTKPWKKDAKPWKKSAADAKPWSKSSERPQKSKFKGQRKPGGYKR